MVLFQPARVVQRIASRAHNRAFIKTGIVVDVATGYFLYFLIVFRYIIMYLKLHVMFKLKYAFSDIYFHCTTFSDMLTMSDGKATCSQATQIAAHV